jgi:hypothetical protein
MTVGTAPPPMMDCGATTSDDENLGIAARRARS